MADRDRESTEQVRSDGGQSNPSRVVDSGDSVGIIERIPGGPFVVNRWWSLASRYEPYLSLNKDAKEPIKRWGYGSIISHWLMVFLMVVVAATGFLFWTGWYGPLNLGIWDGYQVSFYLHTYGGVVLAVIALLVFPLYHKFADGHKLLVTRDQLKELVIIAVAVVGLVKYIPGYKKARRTYDEDENEWVGYHPMQTVFWYVTWFFVGILTLTGFALWSALATDPAWWIAALGFMAGWTTYETMLRLHLIATFWVIGAVAVHAYFAVMPSNWDVAKSMIVGTLPGWRVDEQTRRELEEGLSPEQDNSATESTSVEGEDNV